MKYYSCIYSENNVVFEENSTLLVNLASISKWFFLGFYLEKKFDAPYFDVLYEEKVLAMMIHSSNEATADLALMFGIDNVQAYVDKYVSQIYLRNSQKSLNAGKGNQGTLKDLCIFLYMLSSKFDLTSYKSSIHQILYEGLDIPDIAYGNKPGSTDDKRKYFLGDSMVIYSTKERIIIASMLETFNPYLKHLPLKIFKKVLVYILKKHIRKVLAKEVVLKM